MKSSPPEIAPKTHAWAVATLVLAVLMLLLTVITAVSLPKTLPLYGSKSTFYLILFVASTVTTFAYMAASIGVLTARSWGREALAYTAAAAFTLTILGIAFQVSLQNDPAYAAALEAWIIKSRANNPNTGGIDPATQVALTAKIMVFWAAIAGLIQIVYNICLYRHMSAEPDDLSGTWAEKEPTPNPFPKGVGPDISPKPLSRSGVIAASGLNENGLNQSCLDDILPDSPRIRIGDATTVAAAITNRTSALAAGPITADTGHVVGPVLLHVDHLTKRFGALTAVNDLTFDVHAGEIVGLLGPNGAGKTTAIRCIASLLRPNGGHITLNGFDIVRQTRDAKRELAFVPEVPAAYDLLTVMEHLRFVAAAYGAEDELSRAEEILTRLDLWDKRNALSASLSKGMKQKLACACALIHRARIYCFDEPMIGLDPKGAREMKDILRSKRAEGAAVLMSTHQLEVAERFCDRMVIMDHGTVVAEGALEDLRGIMQGGGGAGATLEDMFLTLTDRS
ncbi:MAG: ABC transporter ATP-binding protein [Capsulimonadaceae bacterium]